MRSLFAIPLLALIPAAPPKPVTPTDIVASAPEKAWQTIPADQLMATAEEMARKIASRGPLAVRAAIEAVMNGSEMPFEEGQFLEATLFGLLTATEDMKEGMGAFLEKRPPTWTGS